MQWPAGWPAEETAWVDLSADGLIAVSGEDAVTFLQGQLTSDVRKLNGRVAQYSGMCSPKGRLYASFLLSSDELAAGAATIWLHLPESQSEFVRKRLLMYVLRSKVKLEDAASQWRRIGLFGTGAVALLQRAFNMLPERDLGVVHAGGGRLIRLGAQRFLLCVPEAAGRPDWLSEVPEVSAERWRWLDIRDGIARIVPETREEFVPQMVNFDLTGAVDFGKGCYTGQEIVARMQYLGRLKRRMYRVHAAEPLTAGEEIYSPDLEGQPGGRIVDAAPAPEGGWDALAVVQIASAGQVPLHAGALDGTELVLRELPYVVAAPDA